MLTRRKYPVAKSLSKRKYLFGTTILAGVIAATTPALAQSPAPQSDPDATQIDEVVVTGSRIRRDPTNAPTPLIQVGREELLSTGLSTVIDYLATIPALSNSVVPSDTTGSLNATGLSLPNLRSLGSGRTLTLVDGRRHVGSQAGTLSVDIDTIPRLLIENIEIITGGASSVYGADAVSGVLNFILRKDFDGLEIDGNYGQINQDGQASVRISALGGVNLLDDRLNLYLFGEYEDLDEIIGENIDWLADGHQIVGEDADPTSPAIGPRSDGVFDNRLYYGVRSVNRPVWGVTTIANAQQPSRLDDPDVPVGNCTSYLSANCYSIDPAKTYWYDNGVARLVNLGTRIGNTGLNRPFNIGGDGYNNTSFSGFSRTPESISSRFQTGASFRVTPDIRAFAEIKYINEQSHIRTQPTFFDVFINDNLAAGTFPSQGVSANVVQGVSGNNYFTRTDNAYLPAMIRTAMLTNTVPTYGTPTNTTPGAVTATTVRNWARHSAFGPDRTQDNTREVMRYVLGLEGAYDNVGFIKNFNWDLSYTYGELQNENIEYGMDKLNLSHALDSVVDTAGRVNGRPGEIVCRVKLLAAQGLPIRNYNPLNPATNLSPTDPSVAGCVPLNVFGAGNQSQAGLDFVSANITVTELNEQEDLIGSVAGQLWDFWGAGPIGIALGGEARREYTEGVGRDATTAGRFLQLNTGADFLGAEFKSREGFAELALPLIRDSWLGDYAELSGSYRYFDYTTAGTGDVYGVNLVYRPIQDIAFKTSFNTSFRAPNLGENFRPRTQTFANGFVDPCDTRQITGSTITIAQRDNRIANCTTLAAARGLTYDFAGTTASTLDDYRPTYSSGVAGVQGGNPDLVPEESESFTFSTVLQPRFLPNLSLVLDYYEIAITGVIATVGANTLANQCVDGPGLNAQACGVIFRNNPTTGDPFDVFKVGAPGSDPVGGFIIGSFNYARRETRGLDFTASYKLDLEEVTGHNWGRLNYNIGGSWLIEQKQYNNATNPNDYTEFASTPFYPRVRFTQRLTWSPNSDLAFTWTMDWQSSQNIVFKRDLAEGGNWDNQPLEWNTTGNFARNDLSVRWNVRDDVTLRAGVTNVFDAEQPAWLGSTLYSNFDPYGRRFNIGFSFRPF
ncbi:TonB-dependent receptor [uncultured Brevundimonas sp.]|uniref:TonB-dependent receptor domain-containing protein n=1 Tax=uncultured Brevundimonas sp. TaxID=213418 RepID=UPI0030EBBA5B|tara:strand:+ start:1131 stop:4508 length:3378 start_codon:yes stop_codon:yes gene_type:complete